MFLIKGGTIVHSDRSFLGDLRLRDGKILEIGHDLELEDGEELIDATGKHVLPGCIDPHVHFRDLDLAYKEDFLTASKAAVAGGVTTVFDMPNSNPPTIDMAGLDAKREVASKAVCNVKFFVGATPHNISGLKDLVSEPDVVGVKVYMGSSTGDLLVDNDDLWDQIFSIDGILVAVHAEMESIIRSNTEKFRTIDDPQIHSVIRSNDAAEAATRRAMEIGFKHGTRLHICHMSTREEVFAVKEFRSNGYDNVTCEVCPHHLIFNTDDYERYGNFLRVNPPIRSREDRNALWEDGIALGVVDVYATDHAPHTIEEKKADYWHAPSGMPAVQEATSLLLHKVSLGELSIEKFVELRATRVASIFGIKDRGILREGYHGDVIIVDLEREEEINLDWLESKCGWSNYEGFKVKGWVEKTFVNGELVFG